MTKAEKTSEPQARLVALHGPEGVGKSTLALYLTQQRGYREVDGRPAMQEEVAQLFGMAPRMLDATGAEPSPLLCNLQIELPAYRHWLHSRGEDMYTPRSAAYHLYMYGDVYYPQFHPNRWREDQRRDLILARGKDVVIPRIRDRGNLQEYDEIKSLAVQENRRLMILRVTAPGKTDYGPPGYGPLPDYAIDGTVEVQHGDISAAITEGLAAIDAWFGD